MFKDLCANKSKKIIMHLLVTGCAGFIGAKVAEIAIQEGHRVTGVDNLNDYYDVRLKRHRLEALCEYPEFSFHEIDIERGKDLDDLFASKGFDAVINLAARAGVRASIEDPHVYMRTNTVGTLNLLERMVRHEVPKFVLASTSSLYAGLPMPFDENALVTRPISPYAATKLAAEATAHVWHHLHGIDVTVLRYFTVFGPAGRPDMAPFGFCERIRRGLPVVLFGDGTQTRDFTYIDDIARGTLAALRPLGYEVVNLGGGNQPMSILEMIEDALGKKAVVDQRPFLAADMRHTAAAIDKAEKVLGWTPSVNPRDGFQRTAAWHLENAPWLDSIPTYQV